MALDKLLFPYLSMDMIGEIRTLTSLLINGWTEPLTFDAANHNYKKEIMTFSAIKGLCITMQYTEGI